MSSANSRDRRDEARQRVDGLQVRRATGTGAPLGSEKSNGRFKMHLVGQCGVDVFPKDVYKDMIGQRRHFLPLS